MKKLFTAMAALALCSTAAFAQDEIVNSVPASGEVESFNFPITITVKQPGATSAMIQTMGGAGFTQTLSEPDFFDINDDKVTFNLTKEMWGDSYDGNFSVQVVVIPVDEDETPFFDDDDEYIMGMIGYTYTPAEAVFVKSSPNDKWLTTTFEQAYENNVFKLYFSREVNKEDVLGTITYFDVDDEEVDMQSISNYSAEWNSLDGMYVISFPYASEDYAAEDLSKIVFNISGVSTKVPSITLNNIQATPQKRIAKKGLEAELGTSSETVNVYSLQGTLVKKNATELSGLQPGLYIVDGKKVVVK